MKKNNFCFLLAIINALAFLASCDSLICCCKYATNTYNTYDSLVEDFVKQSNVKGNFSFCVLNMEETLGNEFVASPVYTLSGIDDCVPCTEECKKTNGHLLAGAYTMSYSDTISINTKENLDSTDLSNELSITINFKKGKGDDPIKPSEKIPLTTEWEEKTTVGALRTFDYGSYFTIELKYETISELNPTDKEERLVKEMDSACEIIRQEIENSMLLKFGDVQ